MLTELQTKTHITELQTTVYILKTMEMTNKKHIDDKIVIVTIIEEDNKDQPCSYGNIATV